MVVQSQYGGGTDDCLIPPTADVVLDTTNLLRPSNTSQDVAQLDLCDNSISTNR